MSMRSWKRPAKAPMSQRSNRRRRGRLIWRRMTMSCWRRIRFSATRAARGATKARTRSHRRRRRAITVPLAYHDGLFLARRSGRRCVAGWSVRGGRGSGAAMATSPSAKPEQIQLTTEYLRPTGIGAVLRDRGRDSCRLANALRGDEADRAGSAAERDSDEHEDGSVHISHLQIELMQRSRRKSSGRRGLSYSVAFGWPTLTIVR
jgi:hypothetical protein